MEAMKTFGYVENIEEGSKVKFTPDKDGDMIKFVDGDTTIYLSRWRAMEGEDPSIKDWHPNSKVVDIIEDQSIDLKRVNALGRTIGFDPFIKDEVPFRKTPKYDEIEILKHIPLFWRNIEEFSDMVDISTDVFDEDNFINRSNFNVSLLGKDARKYYSDGYRIYISRKFPFIGVEENYKIAYDHSDYIVYKDLMVEVRYLGNSKTFEFDFSFWLRGKEIKDKFIISDAVFKHSCLDDISAMKINTYDRLREFITRNILFGL